MFLHCGWGDQCGSPQMRRAPAEGTSPRQSPAHPSKSEEKSCEPLFLL